MLCLWIGTTQQLHLSLITFNSIYSVIDLTVDLKSDKTINFHDITSSEI